MWVLLLLLPLLGVLVWAVFKHFLTADVPAVLKHRIKFRMLHCAFLYITTLGHVLEKLRICSGYKFVRFLEDLWIIKKDPSLVVTNLRFGTIPVRLFQPRAASSEPRRAIIFYHGGGGGFGTLTSYHSLCCFLARETESVVLSVGYRLYPDSFGMVMAEDCYAASVHFLRNLQTYGVDPSLVLVGGESIGGTFVGYVCRKLLARSDLPRIRAQIMICPFLQAINLQLPSHQRYKNVPFLTQTLMLTCLCDCMSINHSWWDAMLNGSFRSPELWKKYQKWLSADNIPKKFKPSNYRPPVSAPFHEAAFLETGLLFDQRFSPLLANDEVVARLPPAFLLSCENDIFRDDALLYKKRLEDLRVPVVSYHVEDGFHGALLFFDKKCFSFPCSRRIVNAVASYIRGIQ
ncbi:arylacetamide deacetylase-like 4 [Echinops telfairi]|uniref:Arylacetamide deacetylase-like 4 n=1 Tax=Echinops telfairi TaxID=9371 RepID=A0ABM0IQK5_ECHTE|nr:arylacetamide deacetylase-like 4 [Echinops telfairi]